MYIVKVYLEYLEYLGYLDAMYILLVDATQTLYGGDKMESPKLTFVFTKNFFCHRDV